MPARLSTSREQYRKMAASYDRGGAREPYASLRPQAIKLLQLRRGEAIADVGCGTGLSFPILEEYVGPEGLIIAIDQSPEMLACATARADTNGWRNVTHIESPVEDAALPCRVDAALFAFSHDIMRTPKAIKNVLQHLKPGGRVAVAGVTWAPWWIAPFNIVLWFQFRRGMTTREGLGRPWSHLEGLVPCLKVRRAGFYWRRGAYYIAWGVLGHETLVTQR